MAEKYICQKCGKIVKSPEIKEEVTKGKKVGKAVHLGTRADPRDYSFEEMCEKFRTSPTFADVRETYWVCPECGRKHIIKRELLEKPKTRKEILRERERKNE